MTSPKPTRSSAQAADDEALKRILKLAYDAPPPIYAPGDDSLLMLDAIAELPLSGKNVLDLGAGSGMLGLYCAVRGAEVTASDIEEIALQHVERIAAILGIRIKLCLSDLFSNILGQFDLILFNPPYLPSVGVSDRSVDGGIGGTVLVDRFLKQLPNHLYKGAYALLLLSSLNDLASVQHRHGSLQFSVVARKPLFFEELQVLRVCLRDDLTI